MSTLQATKPEVANWEKLFPNGQLSQTRSGIFVKKLLAVAISNITFLRNIFPEKAYSDKVLDDLGLKILRDESTCPGVVQVIGWVKGCFEALDNRYLKNMIIGIYNDPKDPETVIESYNFKFAYEEDGSVSMESSRNNEKSTKANITAAETKKSTVRLLRTLILLTSTMENLPDNCMLTMKLLYYEDVTPPDYEPEGFKAANPNSFLFKEEAKTIAVGDVKTNYHGVKLRVKTNAKQFEIDGSQAPIDNRGISVCDSGLDSTQDGHENFIQNEAANRTPEQDNMNEEEEFVIRCPCGGNEDDGLMICCASCSFWQHGVCFLITCEDKAPPHHICDICGKPGEEELEPTDPSLSSMTELERQDMCLWRRTLSVCPEFTKLTTPQLARRLNIENTVAQGLVNRLEKEGFISTAKGKGKSKSLGKVVNQDKIKNVAVPQYLKTPKVWKAKDCDVTMDTVDTISENPVQINVSVEKDINSITENAKEMSLADKKKSSSHKKLAMEKSKSEHGKRERKSRKRARDDQFDFVASQDIDTQPTKKASRASKDMVVES